MKKVCGVSQSSTGGQTFNTTIVSYFSQFFNSMQSKELEFVFRQHREYESY